MPLPHGGGAARARGRVPRRRRRRRPGRCRARTARSALPALERALADGGSRCATRSPGSTSRVVELDAALLVNVNTPRRCSTSLTPRTTTSWVATRRGSRRCSPTSRASRRGERVLDVGAGTGALTAGARAPRRATSPRSIRRRRSSPRCAAASPTSTCAQAPAEELPWPDGSFDARARAARRRVHGRRARRRRRDARVVGRTARRGLHVGSAGARRCSRPSIERAPPRSGEADDRAAALPDARGDRGARRRRRASARALEVEARVRGLRGATGAAARRRRADGRLGRVARRRASRDSARGAVSASSASPSGAVHA